MTLLEPSLVLPFVACVLITLVHVYLGIHVIERKVIFVDLAIAQIAILGAIFGVKMGYDLDNDLIPITFYALAFAVLGALIFSMTRQKYEKVPHEAIIGAVYAIASATTLVLLSKTGIGPEEAKNMLARDIIFVKKSEVIKAIVIFSIVGLIHVSFGKKFMLISTDPEKAMASGMKVWLWDFIFYISFGLALASSSLLMGTLMIFTYLVIPAVIASLFVRTLLARLIFGWTIGIGISYASLKITYDYPPLEAPPGPFIICLFGLLLIIAGIVKYIRDRKDKVRAVSRIFAFAVFFALFVGALIFFQKPPVDPFEDAIAHLSSELTNERVSAVKKLSSAPERKSESTKQIAGRLNDENAEMRKLVADTLAKFNAKEYAPSIAKLLYDKDDNVRESAIKAVRILSDKSVIGTLLAAAKKEQDPYIATEMAEALLELGDNSGIPLLIGIIEAGDTPNEARKDAMEHLKSHVPREVSANGIGTIKKWWGKQDKTQNLKLK